MAASPKVIYVEVGEKYCQLCLDCTVHRKIVGPCKHFVCYRCIQDTMRRNHKGPWFPCPLCHDMCPRPKDGWVGLRDDIPEELQAEREKGEIRVIVLKGDLQKNAEWFDKVVGPSAKHMCGMSAEMKGMSEEEKNEWCARENERLDRENADILIQMNPEEEAKHRRTTNIFEALGGLDQEKTALAGPGRLVIKSIVLSDGIADIVIGDVDTGHSINFESPQRLAQMNTGGCVQNGQLALLEESKADSMHSSRRDRSNVSDCSNAICNTQSSGKLASGLGRKSKNSKHDAALPNDRASRRVRKLKEEWLKESKNGNKSSSSTGTKSEHMDFVLNEKGELCIRYKEKVPAGTIETGLPTVEKCLDIAKVVDEKASDGALAVHPDHGASDGTLAIRPYGGPTEGAKAVSTEPATIADHFPTPEEISKTLGVYVDDLSNVGSTSESNEIWCRICIRFDRASRVSYICIECTGHFCATCAMRHERGIKEHAMQRNCRVHMYHVPLPKDTQCLKCAAVKPLVKPQTKILGAKGWRTDRFNSTEACDRKIKQLKDKQVIQFCKKKFNFDSTSHERVLREQEEYMLMREGEREEMLRMRERDELMQLRKREDMIRMRNIKMGMRMREREEEMRIQQCDREIQEHDRQLQETKAALKAIEDKKDALVRRKEAIVVGKEEFLREMNDHSKTMEASAEIGARMINRDLNHQIKATLVEAQILAESRCLEMDIVQRIEATRGKLSTRGSSREEIRERAERESQEIKGRYKQVIAELQTDSDPDDIYS